jgi:hypothetical protein
MSREYAGKRREQHRLVVRPGRARDQCWRAAAESEEGLVGAHAGDPVHHAVIARIAQDPDALGRDPKPRESRRIFLGDRGGGAYCLVAGAKQCSCRPAQPATAGTHRGRDDGDVGAARGRAHGELGPEVELREDQKIGRQRVEQGLDRARQVIGEIVGHVHRKPAGERLRGRAEMGVDVLRRGTSLPQLEQHALRLKPFAYR